LPPGLTLGATGISGSPASTGIYTFTIRAENILGLEYADEQEFTITILPSNAPVITTDNNQQGIKGIMFKMTLEATGATPIVFAEESILPDGLELHYDYITDIYTIEGIPTTPGVFDFTISAENGDGKDYRIFTLTIGDPPVITTATPLPDGLTEVGYFETLTATGDLPMEWEVQQPIGSETGLPDGLSLNRRTGAISGVPTAAGDFSFRVMVRNEYGSDTQLFSIKIELSAGTFINGDEIANLFINGDEVDEAYVNGVLIYKYV
jgi:hypothetical protein